MDIAVLGINHKTAPLEIREKAAFTDKQKVRAYQDLAAEGLISQLVILSTCNRTEFYALVEAEDSGKSSLFGLLRAEKKIDRWELGNSFYYYSGFEAVAHLFMVTAGLDSMVLGETQILGQVRDAYEKAVANNAVGKELHGLFQQAIHCAKRVQNETKINDKSLSVSYLAVEMIRREIVSFEGLNILVIGAGKMSRLIVKHLYEQGVRDVWITNKTYQNASTLAEMFEGKTIDFSRKADTLPAIDIIISSTGAPHLILYKEDLVSIMNKRDHKPFFIIDIAVPRDVDPAVRDVENVYLYDMDSLQHCVECNMREREKDASAARNLISAEAEKFQTWLRTLSVDPVIRVLRQKADQIRFVETEKYFESKLSSLSEREKSAVKNLTKSIVNAILKDPIVRMKKSVLTREQVDCIESLLYLFRLEEFKAESKRCKIN